MARKHVHPRTAVASSLTIVSAARCVVDRPVLVAVRRVGGVLGIHDVFELGGATTEDLLSCVGQLKRRHRTSESARDAGMLGARGLRYGLTRMDAYEAQNIDLHHAMRRMLNVFR